MPTDIAGLAAALTDVINPIIPLTFVGIVAAFGAVIGGGVLLVKRLSKSLR